MNMQAERLSENPCWGGLVPVLVLGLALSGCGLKTYPKPMSGGPIPPIQDLRTQVRVKAVEVAWSVPNELSEALKDTPYRLVVVKAELNWGNRNCPDCPVPSQQEVQVLDPASPAPAVRKGNTFMWLDTVVSPQRAYRYQVLVRDRNRRQLSTSNPSVVKVIAPPPPLRKLATGSDPRGISLQWQPGTGKGVAGGPSPQEAQFMIERHSPYGAWEQLSPLPVRGTTFVDSTVAGGQAYDYRVTPAYLFEESLILGEPSVFRQARAPDAVPPPPPGNVWVIPAKGALEVHWLKSEGTVQGYHIYRREGKDIVRLTAAPVQAPPFVDQTVKKNVVYGYAVSAVSSQQTPNGHREGLLSKWTEIRSLMIGP